MSHWDLYDEVRSLRNLLVSRARGRRQSESEYLRLRRVVLSRRDLAYIAPGFLHTRRNLRDFWEFIRHKVPRRVDRCRFIDAEFEFLLEVLKRRSLRLARKRVPAPLTRLREKDISDWWGMAVDKRLEDRDRGVEFAGIGLATICREVLRRLGVTCGEPIGLPALCALAAEKIGSPLENSAEELLGLFFGTGPLFCDGRPGPTHGLRDARGRRRVRSRLTERQAELAVNFAALTAFRIVRDWRSRGQEAT